jgi:ATP-binding cassette subfamily B protein
MAFVLIIRLTLDVMRAVAEEAFARVQRFSSDWHAGSFAGSTVRKITRGLWAFDLLNDTVLLALWSATLMLVGTTGLIAWRFPWLGLAVALASLAYIAVTAWLMLRFVAPAATLSNTWDTRLGGVLADAVGCNPVVKAFGAETREEERLARVTAKWHRRTARTWMRGTWSGTAQGALLWLIRGIVVGGALLAWTRGAAGPGDIAFVLTALFVLQGYLRDMGQHIGNLQRSINDLEELVDLHDEPLGVEDRPGAGPIAVTEGRIAFERVGFQYGGHRTPLFQELDLVIEGGQRVGLVGRSGSGKTTFVKLVQRLYDVTEGRITVDGQDVAAVSQASLRSRIAIVQQEPILFHRSLADNIAYGRPGASMAEIERAAALASAHEFVEALPKGYATLVGERGVKLSGGERQRVALAQAFLADAPILILDEATSSLDSEAERAIQDAMERLMVGRTTIVVAHRLSTVRDLDRLLVFDRGRLMEDGPHEALLRRPGGIYRRLVEHQAGGLLDETTAGAA